MKDLIKKIRAAEPTKEQVKDRTPEYAFGWVDSLNATTEIVKNHVVLDGVSGTVWVVQDTMNGMIAGMFDSQQKAIKYANGSANMAVTNMEVI